MTVIINQRTMQIFAHFKDEQAKAEVLKLKKNKTATISGTFQSFGSAAIVLDNCQLSSQNVVI